MYELLFLQNNQPSDKARLTPFPHTMAKFNFDLSEVPWLRIRHLLSSQLIASNRQGKEILPIHLLVANLDSVPFSNLG